MKFLVRLIVTALTLVLIAKIVPGISIEEGPYVALVAAFAIAVLNAIVRPVLVFLTFPITVITLGVFLLIINAGLFLLAGMLVDGFYVESMWSALFGSLLLSIISGAMNKFV